MGIVFSTTSSNATEKEAIGSQIIRVGGKNCENNSFLEILGIIDTAKAQGAVKIRFRKILVGDNVLLKGLQGEKAKYNGCYGEVSRYWTFDKWYRVIVKGDKV